MSADYDSVSTDNEYAIQVGENLPNHTFSLRGRGKFVQQGFPSVPQFRTRQQAYRYAAYLVTLAENHLPDEEVASSFEEIKAAIENV